MKITIISQLQSDTGVIKSAFGITSINKTQLWGYPVNKYSQGSIMGASTNFRLVLKR